MSDTIRNRPLAAVRRDEEEGGKRNLLYNWIQIVVLSIFLALILRAYIFQAYSVPSQSMENTLLIGDYILAEKVTYKFRPPMRGEIVIFKYPLNPDKDFIKRCIAVEGDTVVIRDKVVYVNEVPFPDPPTVKFTDSRLLSGIYSTRDNYGPKVVPRGKIFVLGDNRDNSQDSRFWGFLPVENIKARPLFVYFSWAPDPNAPEWSSPLSIIPIIFYNITHFPSRVRWSRIFKPMNSRM